MAKLRRMSKQIQSKLARHLELLQELGSKDDDYSKKKRKEITDFNKHTDAFMKFYEKAFKHYSEIEAKK